MKSVTMAMIMMSSLTVSSPEPIQSQSPISGPAHIVLGRHAEKPDDSKNPHLSKAGRERATAFASFIMDDPQPPKWKDSVFDMVYIITYTNGLTALSTSRYGVASFP